MMGSHVPALAMALLAVLSTGAATAASHQDRVSTVAAFAVDVQALAETYCRPAGDQGKTGVCHLMTPPAGIEWPAAVQAATSKRAARRPQWRVTGIDLAADPVMTSCGVWNVALRLHPLDPQPASPALANGLMGRLHLVNPATGQTADFPLLPGAFADDPDDPTEPDCLPDWVVKYPCLLKEYEDMGCELCSDTKRSMP